MSADYAEFIGAVRRSRGLTQAELAETTGISQPNLSAYESGRRTPSLESLNRVVVACGYQLVAEAGSRRLRLPLPSAGWFPDDDLPPTDPSDPVDEPAPTPARSQAARGRQVYEVMQLGAAQS